MAPLNTDRTVETFAYEENRRTVLFYAIFAVVWLCAGFLPVFTVFRDKLDDSFWQCLPEYAMAFLILGVGVSVVLARTAFQYFIICEGQAVFYPNAIEIFLKYKRWYIPIEEIAGVRFGIINKSAKYRQTGMVIDIGSAHSYLHHEQRIAKSYLEDGKNSSLFHFFVIAQIAYPGLNCFEEPDIYQGK